MRWIFVVVLLLVAGAMPAPAQGSNPYCRFYFGDETHAPPEILGMLRRRDGSAVRMCPSSAASFPDTYFLHSRPSLAPFGVCQVTRWPLLKEDGSLKFIPLEMSGTQGRSLHMMISGGDCPRQDDVRYIYTEGVTAGVFVAAVRFWEELSSSRDRLDDLIARLREGESSEAEDFEVDFRKGNVRLSAVRLKNSNFMHAAPYFALDLGHSGTFWSLLVDFEDDELVVLGLGMTIVD